MIASVVPAPSVPAGIAYTSDELRRGEAALDRGGPDHPAAALRPVVQPEHGDHGVGQPGRHGQRAGALPDQLPVRDAGLLQLGREQLGQRADRAGDPHPPGRRVDPDDLGSGRLDRGPDQLDVGRVGAVPVGQLVAAHPLAGRQRGAPPQHDRDLDPLARVDRTDDLGAGDRRPDAARDPHARLALHPLILPQRQDRPRVSGTAGRSRLRPCRSRPPPRRRARRSRASSSSATPMSSPRSAATS